MDRIRLSHQFHGSLAKVQGSWNNPAPRFGNWQPGLQGIEHDGVAIRSAHRYTVHPEPKK